MRFKNPLSKRYPYTSEEQDIATKIDRLTHNKNDAEKRYHYYDMKVSAMKRVLFEARDRRLNGK